MRGLKKSHEKGQTDRHTDGHRDSMIESAQWADSMEILLKKNYKLMKHIFRD